MKSEAHPDLLDREAAKEKSKETIERVCPPLRQLIDYGTHVLKRMCASPMPFERIGIAYSYRQVLESLDTAEVLFSEAVWEPAAMPIRSCIENVLKILYITETDSRRRGLAYLYDDIETIISNYERFIPDSIHGKKFRQALLKEGRDVFVKHMDSRDVAGNINEYKEILKGPIFDEVREARDAYIEKKRKAKKQKERKKAKPQWYSIFTDVELTGINGLAAYCGLESMYLFLYKDCCTILHGNNFFRLGVVGSETVSLTPLRHNPDNGMWILAMYLGRISTNAILSLLFPEDVDEFERWYQDITREVS